MSKTDSPGKLLNVNIVTAIALVAGWIRLAGLFRGYWS
jgi:hypothetical protein